MSNRTLSVQRDMVNDVVKELKDVKVIVLKNGTVQVVGINETNVDDGLPNIDPIAEIIPDTVPFSEVVDEEVEVEEVVQPVEVKVVKVQKVPKAPKEKADELNVTKE